MNDLEQRLADALAEFLDRQAQGDTFDVAAFCARHPDLADELQLQIQAVAEFDQISNPVSASVSERGRPPAPERLSGLKTLGEIGAGGMCRVFLAFDEGLGRKVAIKTLSARIHHEPPIRSRFLQEARAMARVTHPNVVRIYNLGPADEPPHFVMEYVEGVPLTEAARPLTIPQKVELMRKVVLAVENIHQHHIVHRDLKPSNMLTGPDLEPKVLDFGLALHVDERERLTKSGEVAGTPEYFSPEQARGEPDLDARSDIFSPGTVLYQLLTGRTPFPGVGRETVRAICEDDPVIPRRLDATNSWSPPKPMPEGPRKERRRSLCLGLRDGSGSREVPGWGTCHGGAGIQLAPYGCRDCHAFA